ncbi:MAG TPA: hypothetical protein VE690_04370, partial [Rhodopila sp.]|nr:hypothetical protein [Rhodopila sp.]
MLYRFLAGTRKQEVIGLNPAAKHAIDFDSKDERARVTTMGQLLVRDLDDEVIRRLKKRAAANGRSTEAEHRAILEAAVR